MKKYYVYIVSSESGTLYIGVTNNLLRRIDEHKNGVVEGFTKKYGCKKLVYYEEFSDSIGAILREKQLKKWSREKKIQLIGVINKSWEDLSNYL